MPTRPDQVETLSISSQNGRVDFTPQGGYVLQWSVNNPKTGLLVPVLYQGNDIKRTGIPPLVPGYELDIEGVRRHGFGRDSLWVPQTNSTEQAQMMLDTRNVKFSDGETYPKGVQFGIILSVNENGSLDYSFSTANKSQEDVKAGPSVHPYFNVAQKDKPLISFFGIPGLINYFKWDTNTSPDMQYPFAGRMMGIQLADGSTIVIEDLTPGEKGFDRAQLWSLNPKEDAHNHDLVCLEALGRVQTLKPGESMESVLRFSYLFPHH